jgi:hypothetical protein
MLVELKFNSITFKLNEIQICWIKFELNGIPIQLNSIPIQQLDYDSIKWFKINWKKMESKLWKKHWKFVHEYDVWKKKKRKRHKSKKDTT